MECAGGESSAHVHRPSLLWCSLIGVVLASGEDVSLDIDTIDYVTRIGTAHMLQ